MADLTDQKGMISYSYGLINTPFMHAGQTEDHEIGQYLRIALIWRSISLFCLSLSFLVLLFLIYQLTVPRVKVIGVDVFPNGFVSKAGLLMEDNAKS